MGRPRKPETEHRSERVAFRLSPDELSMLETAAKQTGLPLSVYARQIALRGRVSVRQGKGFTPEAFTALQRVGVNLNQIAHALNQGRDCDHATLNRTLAQLNDLLAEGISHGASGR